MLETGTGLNFKNSQLEIRGNTNIRNTAEANNDADTDPEPDLDPDRDVTRVNGVTGDQCDQVLDI